MAGNAYALSNKSVYRALLGACIKGFFESLKRESLYQGLSEYVVPRMAGNTGRHCNRRLYRPLVRKRASRAHLKVYRALWRVGGGEDTYAPHPAIKECVRVLCV